MSDMSFDDTVVQTVKDLLCASRDCAEYDPAMAAQFAATADGLGRDLGFDIQKIRQDVLALPNPLTKPAADRGRDFDDDDDEDREITDLLHLLDLQRTALRGSKALQAAGAKRGGWLGLDIWSRW
jgi:hypothetical protein